MSPLEKGTWAYATSLVNSNSMWVPLTLTPLTHPLLMTMKVYMLISRYFFPTAKGTKHFAVLIMVYGSSAGVFLN